MLLPGKPLPVTQKIKRNNSQYAFKPELKKLLNLTIKTITQ